MSSQELHIGKMIREIVESRHISTREMARRTGVSPRTIRYYYDRKQLSLAVLRRLSRALNEDFVMLYSLPDSRKLVAEAKETDIPSLQQATRELRKELAELRAQQASAEAAHAEKESKLSGEIEALRKERDLLQVRLEAGEKSIEHLKEVIGQLSRQ